MTKPALFTILGIAAIATWALVNAKSSMNAYISNDVAEVHQIRRALSVISSSSNDIDSTSEKDNSAMRKFIILSQQRSGARFLASLLNKHSSIKCGNEELFNRLKKRGLRELMESQSFDEYMKQISISMDLLRGSEKNDVIGNFTHVGFELMYDQGVKRFSSHLLHELNEENVKIIHLIRKNKLHQYVSHESFEKDRQLRAEMKHKAHPTNEAEVSALDSSALDGNIRDIFDYIMDKNSENRYLEELLDAEFGRKGYYTVYYEDLNRDVQGEMASIFDFLDLNHETVESEYVKIHKGKPTREYFVEED
eukprot:CAMPEP_0171450758 /NCGR_PEP_ID=MMETSP0881-20121228/40793_1 /TAXON_ID=67004 /ORGANISM="Thalassiosira weissflogii, Strain CCMP1336" /LENGTH=307 /DNA_ID=CAMNT_0011975221 /DNA_START=38 /DNA_END=958 /DNA_ORIENTATION=+